jgi:hypothetical protein
MLIFITDMGYSGIFRDATSGGYSGMPLVEDIQGCH